MLALTEAQICLVLLVMNWMGLVDPQGPAAPQNPEKGPCLVINV